MAFDLRGFGYNYSYENLKKIALFASRFNEDEIREQPVTQIPWGTLIGIMNKSSSKEEMLWHINQTQKQTRDQIFLILLLVIHPF